MDDRQYFAQLDENNVVLQVRVVTREFLEANPDRYQGRWVETFYDTPSKMYAGIGFIYIDEIDNFVAPQPFPSWSLDANHDWQPPIPMPEGDEDTSYYWSEDDMAWLEIFAG